MQHPCAIIHYFVSIVGTETVILACLDSNIKYLLYTSSATAEDKLGAYGESKRQAEDLVLGANHGQLQNGKILSTCALRPLGMYGEGDSSLLETLNSCIFNNAFIRLGNDDPVFQYTYAGNIAWAFVSAIRRLRESTKDDALLNPRGRAVNVDDNTPRQSHSQFMEPFVTHVGAKLSAFYVPYWVLLIIAVVCEWISCLLKPIHPIKFPLSKMGVESFYSLPIVQKDEAKSYLGYEPLYTYETALSRSLRYYGHVCSLRQ